MKMSATNNYLAVAWSALLLSAFAGNHLAVAQSRLPPAGECPQPRFTGKAPPDYLARTNPLSATPETLAVAERLYNGKSKPLPKSRPLNKLELSSVVCACAVYTIGILKALTIRANVIIAEANYTSDYSYYDYYLRTYIARQYHHRDNIIRLSVNKDGTILWSNMVSKEQTSEDDDNRF